MSNIRSNRFYNDPNIGAAFSNLAQLFAPPSAQDTYAYARAKAEREQAERETEAFARMTADGADPATVDRFGVAIGRFNPTQSYHAVDVKDVTDRRGQDIQSADRRYGVDVDARTDLARNAADNAGALDRQKLMSLGDFYKPISEGQIRPAVPSDIARMYGTQNALPQAEGRDKPLSETEWRAAQAEHLRGEGKLSNDQLVDLITGAQSPVEAVGPDGRTPMFMTPGAAVRMGAQPAPRSPSTVINNAPGSDSGEFYKEADKARGKSFNDVADAGATARRSMIQIDELDRTLADVGTGGLAAMKAFAGSYGLPVGDLSDIQAASALINQLVPAQRAPGSGTMSDGDVALFKQSLPRIVNQPGGNALIIRTIRGIAQYDAQRGDIANRVLDREITPADGRRMMAELPNPLAAFRQDTGQGGNFSLPRASASPNRSAAAPVRVTTPEEAARLPSGTRIILPDGSEGRVR